MTTIELVFLSIGLAMDAFAVAICKGLCMKKMYLNKAIIVGIYFGLFQMIMPIIGYGFSMNFQKYINEFDHWIAFLLLFYIGIKMIKDKNSEIGTGDSTEIKNMLLLSIATSIDALAVGISLAFLNVPIFKASIIIGSITFAISFLGVIIGNIFENKYKMKAQILGGSILIIIAFKILFSHLL